MLGSEPESAVTGRTKELAPSSEATAYAEARDLAKRRVRFLRHAIVWGSVWFFLLVAAGFKPAVIVALAWGIPLALHGYGALLAPALERRFFQEELRWRLERADALPPPSPALAPAPTPTPAPAPPADRDTRRARALEELSASIAHEIRNPIAAAKSLVQQMGEDPSSLENIEYAKVALEELERVEQSIAHLLRYAREEPLQLEPVQLSEIADSALETFRDRLAKHSVKLVKEYQAPGAMRGDPEKLRRVVINLVGNALDAMAEGPTPDATLTVRTGDNLAGTESWLEVVDNGPGIAPAMKERAFSPFASSKSHGTGLGLPISKKLVEAHRGTIELKSEAGLGTTFTAVFPKASSSKETST
jgi:signal transduction histidine kinase